MNHDKQHGHHFGDRKKNAIQHPGYAEDDCPWWDDDWWGHCSPEADYVEPLAVPAEPVILPAPDPQPLLLAEWSVTTPPLRRAAISQGKDQPVLLKHRENAIVPGHAVLATVRDPVAYAETMRLYRARLAARGTPDEATAQRAWNQHSAASVLATRRTVSA